MLSLRQLQCQRVKRVQERWGRAAQRKVLLGLDHRWRLEQVATTLTETGADRGNACISSSTLDLCNSSNFHRDLQGSLGTPYMTVLGASLTSQKTLVGSCWGLE